MLLLRTGAFLLILLPVLCAAQLEIAGCRSYQPEVVSLHGKLLRKTFAGPPNYHDIRKGDEAETVWLVKLDSPICVNQDKAEPDLNPSQKNVRRVQLVLNKKTASGPKPCWARELLQQARYSEHIRGTTILLSS